jgi:hypothetical protein
MSAGVKLGRESESMALIGMWFTHRADVVADRSAMERCWAFRKRRDQWGARRGGCRARPKTGVGEIACTDTSTLLSVQERVLIMREAICDCGDAER